MQPEAVRGMADVMLEPVRENEAVVAERIEATAIHQELLKLLGEFVGEQKQD